MEIVKKEEKKQDRSVHETIHLLLARMTSNPEEYPSRWRLTIEKLRTYMNGYEKTLIKNKEREVMMQLAHVEIMKRLLEVPKQ